MADTLIYPMLAIPQSRWRKDQSRMDNRPHILIVDDESEICEALREYLVDEGYRVSVAPDGAAMRRVIGETGADLVLLDVVLPGEDGLALARWLRGQDPTIGIIMLTGRGDTIDRIIGLELGADDYLAKPFHLRELLARVKSVGRRRARTDPAEAENAAQVRFAGWSLDLNARQLRSPAGENVRLTGGEFSLLATFINHPNQVLSRDRLLDLVCGREAGPFDRSIDVQVGRLRRKLNDDRERLQLIKTVRGGGYMFTSSPERAASGRGGQTIEPRKSS
jgi:two-component system OmpR family response regulator